MAKTFEFIIPLNCPKVQPDPFWECCLGTMCACPCLIPHGLQGDNPVSPGAARESHSTAFSSVITDRAVSLPFFPQSCEENLARRCFARSSMHFWTGCAWWEPALSEQAQPRLTEAPQAPLPSSPKSCTGGAALSFPK